MKLGASNPFVRLEHHQGSSSRLPPVTATSSQLLESSKLLANEVRRDDSTMSKELAVLAPRSTRYYTLQEKKKAAGSTNASSAAGMVLGHSSTENRRSEAAVGSIEFHGKITMDEFIAKKREVGLVHMSLSTKRAEIRKLEEEIDCAEKKLHQQQEQLENTHEKFNNFLKHSNLEQDAAVRRADAETKAKQSKKVEIKKLSARINHVELEIRKAELQVETCKMYKKFLDDLAKPRWFFDVLIDLRVADEMDEILQLTEAEFDQKSSILRAQYEKEVRYREERARVAAEMAGRGGRSSIEGEGEEQELVPLSVQLKQLHEKLEKEVHEKVQAVTESIREEVNALTVEEVREVLERDYDEGRKPTYYTNVEQLLDIFINVEEGNLFLIQNCQELEEELERVASEYLAEKNETMAMTRQRHAQMSALSEKIRGAQLKLKQLEERAADLEKHVPSKSASGEVGGKNTNPSGMGNRKDPKNPNASNENGGGGIGVKLTPEQFKQGVEHIITRIFRTLTSGDAVIKSLYTSLQSQASSGHASLLQGTGKHHGAHDDGFGGDGTGFQGEEYSRSRRNSSMIDGGEVGGGSGGKGGGSSTGNKNNSKNFSRNEKKDQGRSTASHQKAGSRARSRSANGTRKGGNTKKKGEKEGANHANGADTTSPTAHHSHADQSAGSNMGPVEMLTIIENKLEEYHRTISDARNGIDENLIQQVMKASDKERRRQARLVHMAKQAQDQEERSRRALERSHAPIVRCIGKPVLPRSRLPKDSASQKRRKSLVRGGSTTDNDSEFNEFL